MIFFYINETKYLHRFLKNIYYLIILYLCYILHGPNLESEFFFVLSNLLVYQLLIYRVSIVYIYFSQNI